MVINYLVALTRRVNLRYLQRFFSFLLYDLQIFCLTSPQNELSGEANRRDFETKFLVLDHDASDISDWHMASLRSHDLVDGLTGLAEAARVGQHGKGWVGFVKLGVTGTSEDDVGLVVDAVVSDLLLSVGGQESQEGDLAGVVGLVMSVLQLWVVRDVLTSVHLGPPSVGVAEASGIAVGLQKLWFPGSC